MRPWIVGSTAEVVGTSIGDGASGRITDPVTGVGAFNPNLDPNIVGVDPQTGADAPAGTDMGPGAPYRRQAHTNVINGDFSALPNGGVDSVIVSDPTSADYNPLPGWTWTPSDSVIVGSIVADSSYGSGYRFSATNLGFGAVSGTGTLEQLVAIPISQGQQYRVLPSAYWSGGLSASLKYQFIEADATTTIGSEVTTSTLGSGEIKVDAGLVPPTAAYIRIRWEFGFSVATESIGEVRCAFLPAEATLGLKSITANSATVDAVPEVAIVSAIIPAGTFTVGSVYRITAVGTVTSSATNIVTFRCRVGPTTLTGSIATTIPPTATASASADGFVLEMYITCRSAGAGGTVIGAGTVIGQSDTQPFQVSNRSDVATAAVAVDTTVANLLELTCVTAANTTTVIFRQAFIECVMAG